MTKRGYVIEGNYRVGEQVLLVFDKSSRRYLPAFRKKKEHIPEEDDLYKRLYQVEYGTTLYCAVELKDVPVYIKPMVYREDGKIRPWEVEGIDYVKTYYEVTDPGNCVVCPTDFNVCKHGQSDPLRCKPFYYLNPDLPSNPRDRLNHCIYSLESCDAEILQIGSDSGGSYIIWKAYTDKQSGYSGLGYMRLMFFRKTPQGKIVCSADAYIKVDCCKKDVEFRRTKIYWTKCPELFETWCHIPDDVAFSDLIYFWQMGGWIIMELKVWPEEDGGCIPFNWDLAGIGELEFESWDENKIYATYKISAADFNKRDCHDTLTITATNRCYNSEVRFFKSCCEENKPLSISYTALTMGCGQSQDLTALGGCPPYVWSLSGGGNLQWNPEGNTQFATYQAPSSNPNCSSNPTISVTDCCGATAEVKLAVNCYVVEAAALRNCTQTVGTCECIEWYGGNCVMYQWYGADFHRWDYDCAGNIILYAELLGDAHSCNPGYQCTGGDCILNGGDCSVIGGFSCPGQSCNTVRDLRTPEMKAQGCCPLNPLTGLPY